jgi:hypothetical protein
MAVRDIRPDVAWETAIAMGAGGQGAMGQAFMELDQGRPGQERVRKPRSMQPASGGLDARGQAGPGGDMLSWTIGRLVWQLTQERT